MPSRNREEAVRSYVAAASDPLAGSTSRSGQPCCPSHHARRIPCSHTPSGAQNTSRRPASLQSYDLASDRRCDESRPVFFQKRYTLFNFRGARVLFFEATINVVGDGNLFVGRRKRNGYFLRRLHIEVELQSP